VRQGLAARIADEPDMEVCGEAPGVDEALALLDATKPALVIVDLSAHEEALYGERSIRAGAHGYVSKQEAQGKIIAAMRAVLRGESTRSIAQKLHLSVHTIESHRENIRAKLSVKNGAELVQRAVQWVLEPRA
jgi:DNA-binding NarL/FixJ family response regulator